MKTILSIISFFIFNALVAQSPDNDASWQLIWEDDFITFDQNKWLKNNYGAITQHNFIFMEDMVNINQGNLELTAMKENITCPTPSPPVITWATGGCTANDMFPQKSGWIETHFGYSVKYGYIEARIKMSIDVKNKGLKPAFWLWQNAESGTSSYSQNEIDIFEFLPSKSSNWVTNNVWLSYPNGYDFFADFEMNNPNHPNILCDYDFGNFTYKDWHTYGVEWSPSQIIWYIDNQPIRLIENPGVFDFSRIIFSVGISDPEDGSFSNNDNAKMSVDWIKYYKMDNSLCNTDITLTGNITSHDNLVRRIINIGEHNTSSSVISTPTTFRATQNIIIKGELEIPLGTEVTFNVTGNSCY